MRSCRSRAATSGSRPCRSRCEPGCGSRAPRPAGRPRMPAHTDHRRCGSGRGCRRGTSGARSALWAAGRRARPDLAVLLEEGGADPERQGEPGRRQTERLTGRSRTVSCRRPWPHRFTTRRPSITRHCDSRSRRGTSGSSLRRTRARCRVCRRADNERESLVRDIHDGTLSCDIPADVRDALSRRIGRRDPKRARELERLIEVARRTVAEARLARPLGAGRLDGRLGRRVSAATGGAVWRHGGARSRPFGERGPDVDSACRRHVAGRVGLLPSLL